MAEYQVVEKFPIGVALESFRGNSGRYWKFLESEVMNYECYLDFGVLGAVLEYFKIKREE